MLMWPVTGLCFRRFSKISDYFVAFQHSTFCVDVLCSLYTTSHIHLYCPFIVLFSSTQTHTDTVACFFSWFFILPKDFNMKTARSGDWSDNPPISGWPTLPPEALLLVRKIKNFRLTHTNLWRWKAEDIMQNAPVFTWMFFVFFC